MATDVIEELVHGSRRNYEPADTVIRNIDHGPASGASIAWPCREARTLIRARRSACPSFLPLVGDDNLLPPPSISGAGQPRRP